MTALCAVCHRVPVDVEQGYDTCEGCEAELTAQSPGEIARLRAQGVQYTQERDDDDPEACTNPGGHEWNRSAGEADEARLSGNYADDNIRCIHCGADGDA